MNKSRVKLNIGRLVGLAFIWIVGIPLPGHADVNDAQTLFEAGNAAYAAGEFEEAIAAYESLLSEYSDCSTEYNLGNAHFKAGHLGEAILHYERAKSLSPNNEDVQSNLMLANMRVIDRIEPLPSNGLSDLWERMVAAGMFVWYARGFMLMWTVGFGCLAWRLFAQDVDNRRVLGSVGTVILVLGASLGWLSLLSSARIDESRRAIIMAPTVDIWSAPEGQAAGSTNTALFVLHEGTRVRLLDETQTWQEIELDDGQVGWLPKSSLTEI